MTFILTTAGTGLHTFITVHYGLSEQLRCRGTSALIAIFLPDYLASLSNAQTPKPSRFEFNFL